MVRSPHNRGLTAKHARRYTGLVEDCRHANVPDILNALTPEERRAREVYVPPEYGVQVVLVRTRKGAISPWWWAQCGKCGRSVEALHKPPWSDSYFCVRCHDLTYASRRHGKSERSFSRQLHRRSPGHRTRQRVQREREKAMREAARVRRERDHLARRQERAAERNRLAVAEALPHLLGRVKDKPIVIASDRRTGPRVVPWNQLVEEVTQAMIAENEREGLRDELAADAEENAAVLARYSPHSRALKAQAARVLDRLGAVYVV